MTPIRLSILLLLLAAASNPSMADEGAQSGPPATPDDYVNLALSLSPRNGAARAHAEAAQDATARAGRLPEPVASASVFVRSVETRTGPQQARVGIFQPLPWPARLRAQSSSAQAEADGAEAQVGAVAIQVEHVVRSRFWSLWELRQVQRARLEHLELLSRLAETTQARVETGSASLADLQQVNLAHARLADELRTLATRERSMEAALRAAVGLDGTLISLRSQATRPEPELPTADASATLSSLAMAHPAVDRARARELAAAHAVTTARSSRAPDLRVGVDWIVTGPALDPSIADSGKDAWVVGAGLELPLWQRSYGKDVASAQAAQRARGEELRQEEQDRQAGLTSALATVHDTARQHLVVRDTLLPQAEAAYTSVLGDFTVGKADVAPVLLAQRDLLELRVALDTTAADHARAWAALEAVCGSAIERRPATGENDDVE